MKEIKQQFKQDRRSSKREQREHLQRPKSKREKLFEEGRTRTCC
jgi:hypothetical protein